jgi:hypothetical protein
VSFELTNFIAVLCDNIFQISEKNVFLKNIFRIFLKKCKSRPIFSDFGRFFLIFGHFFRFSGYFPHFFSDFSWGGAALLPIFQGGCGPFQIERGGAPVNVGSNFSPRPWGMMVVRGYIFLSPCPMDTSRNNN